MEEKNPPLFFSSWYSSECKVIFQAKMSETLLFLISVKTMKIKISISLDRMMPALKSNHSLL